MEYLVQLRLISSVRPMRPDEGIAFIEQLIFPTLDKCKKLLGEKKILAGGTCERRCGTCAHCGC